MLETLGEKVDPAHAAVIVVDVLNDFCAPDGMAAREGLDLTAGQAMAARVPRLVSAARSAGALVVFLRNVYNTDENAYLSDVWLEQSARMRSAGSYTRAPVCEPNSWGGEFYGDVRPEPGDVVVVKHRFSGFQGTDLEQVLRVNGVRTVIMTGIVTNVCVETTAREAFMRDFYVVMTSDGCAAYVQADHEQTLSNVKRFFGDVASIDDVIGEWQRS
jgi:ureidoacrylate peracid hydrolase